MLCAGGLDRRLKGRLARLQRHDVDVGQEDGVAQLQEIAQHAELERRHCVVVARRFLALRDLRSISISLP